MEEENLPNSLVAMAVKDQYEQFMRKVEAKHEELVRWMQASHEEFMQNMMHQTQNNISASAMVKETSKRDVNMSYDASANKGSGIKEHSSSGMENPNNFQEDGLEEKKNDEGPSSDLTRSTILFGAQTGSSSSTFASIGVNSSAPVGTSFVPVIGSTSTPVFKCGQPCSNIFGRTSLFQFGTQTGSSMYSGTASSIPALDATSLLDFGTPSTPAYCSTSNPFHGISTFGQKPSFGEFGSQGPAQLSPSESIFGKTRPAFVSQPFGAISTSACGSTSTPAFVATTPIFGAMNALAYSSFNTPATGASRNPTVGIGSTPTVGQSIAALGGTPTPTFGSSPAFGSTGSSLSFQTSAFGARSKTPIFGSLSFGQTPFGRPRGSCRLASYTSTNETDNDCLAGQAPGKLISISAMPTKMKVMRN